MKVSLLSIAFPFLIPFPKFPRSSIHNVFKSFSKVANEM